MPMYRVRVDLGGFSGAPGLNTWWFKGDGATPADANIVGNRLQAFYEGVKPLLVTGMTITIPDEMDIFDEATAVLSGSLSMGGPFPATSGAGVQTTLSRATQLKTQFLTGRVSDGRRVAGGIYLGPIHSGAILSSGVIDPTDGEEVVDALSIFSDSLTGNVQHAVYRQPRLASAPGGARAGAGFYVIGYGYKPLPAVIRSRRD